MILAYFDLGSSVGIDDAAFADHARLSRFAHLAASEVQFPSREAVTGIHLGIGAGIRVDLSGSEILQIWRADALKRARREGLADLFERCPVSECVLDVYALGIGFLRLGVGDFPLSTSSALVDLFQCYEHAGYERTSALLKGLACIFLDTFRQGTDLELVSERRRLQSTPDYEVIPGFLCLPILDQQE